MPKLSRRSLMRTAIGVASLSAAAAQAQSPAVSDSSSLLAAARSSVADNAKTLAAVPLPQSTEPAFSFKP